MNKNTIIKIILLIFFVALFAFLFFYFYKPIADQGKKDDVTETKEEDALFPFLGGFVNNNKEKEENTESENQNTTQIKPKKEKEIIPRLRQISKIPTAGAYIEKISKTEIFDLNKNREKEDHLDLEKEYSEIRFVSMKNNHLYRTYDFTLQEERISNITIPKIFEALFFNKDNYIVRYINDFKNIKSYSIKISDKTKEEIEEEKINNPDSQNYKLKKFQGIFLPDDILNLHINKENQNIFYTQEEKENSENKIRGITSTKDAENKKQIFTSELKEWNFNFNSPNFILATTKPSSEAFSHSISLNTKTASTKSQSKQKIALLGLPNYDFTKILYSYKKDDSYVLYIKDTKTQEEKIIPGLSTFIDKCVWSKNNIQVYCATRVGQITGDYLENWYKGKVYFDQNDIVVIDSKENNYIIIYKSFLNKKNFDMIDLQLDDLEKYIYFKDKKTDFYWSYRIKELPQEEQENN